MDRNKMIEMEVHALKNQISYYQEMITEFKSEEYTVKDSLWYAKLDGMYEYMLSSIADNVKELEGLFKKTVKEATDYPF